MSKWTDFLVSQLSEEDQFALRVGRNMLAQIADQRSRECQECSHPKHGSEKCGQHLEYDICSEKDICQCTGSGDTNND